MTRRIIEWTLSALIAVGMLSVCYGLVYATFAAWETRIAQLEAR